MTFWIITTLMVIAGLLLLLPALRGKKGSEPGGNREQNISIAKERMSELKNELEAGTLTQETYEETLEELEIQNIELDLARNQAISASSVLSISFLVSFPFMVDFFLLMCFMARMSKICVGN